jgi:imidazolonepropionase-like amidohydrolase
VNEGAFQEGERMMSLEQLKLSRRQFIGRSVWVGPDYGWGLLQLLCLTGAVTLPIGREFLSKLLLTNFKLFDGMNNRLDKGQSILIQEGSSKSRPDDGSGRIWRVQSCGSQGNTLMPGLIDNHVHITVPQMSKVTLNFFRQMDQQIVNNFGSCVMNGVTTVRDVGGFPGKILKYRALSDSNQIPGPRVISSLSHRSPKRMFWVHRKVHRILPIQS